jgi:hypothetical protein
MEDGIKDAHDRVDALDTDDLENASNLGGATLTDVLDNNLFDEVKIGGSTINAGDDNIAIGNGAEIADTATGNNNIAMGKGAFVGQSNSNIAIGDGAYAEAAIECVSIGKSAVAGTGPSGGFAAALRGITIGKNSRCTEDDSIAIGTGALATDTRAISIGSDGNKATALDSMALGTGAQATASFSIAIGFVEASNSGVIAVGNDIDHVKVAGDFTVDGVKSFEIPHPNPTKKETHRIRHGCVESPTEGDTLYRYTITATTNGESVEVQLPDYFEYLNKNVDVWVNGKGHFGRAYGEVVGDKLNVTCELAGEYKVLVIGTRNDDAVQNWSVKGVEREIGESWLGETYAFEVDEIIQVTEIKEA